VRLVADHTRFAQGGFAMSEEKDVTFTDEEICQQAQANANFFSLGTILYSKEHTLSMDEYWAFMGRTAARGWT
jgi:hypothetical protein